MAGVKSSSRGVTKPGIWRVYQFLFLVSRSRVPPVGHTERRAPARMQTNLVPSCERTPRAVNCTRVLMRVRGSDLSFHWSCKRYRTSYDTKVLSLYRPTSTPLPSLLATFAGLRRMARNRMASSAMTSNSSSCLRQVRRTVRDVRTRAIFNTSLLGEVRCRQHRSMLHAISRLTRAAFPSQRSRVGSSLSVKLTPYEVYPIRPRPTLYDLPCVAYVVRTVILSAEWLR